MSIHSYFSPEIQTLLYSGQLRIDGALDTASQYQIKIVLESGIHWNELIEMSLCHKMLPLMYKALNRSHEKLIPTPIINQLHTMANHIVMYNITLTRELLSLLELLNAHHIPALTFKGPALTSLLYNNPALRLFGDLDILVHPQDILRSRELLLAHGYRLQATSHSYASEAEMLQYGHAFQVEHEKRHISVDLHWRLGGALSPLPLTFEHLWQQQQTISLLGTPVKTFGTEDLLIYLCLHGAKHLWCKLGWICDVATLVRRQPDLINDAFNARIKDCGVERMVHLGLLAARHYFGAPLPEAMQLRALADSAVTFLLKEVGQRLFPPTPATYEPTRARLYRRYLQCRMRERFRDQVALSLAVMASLIRPTKQDRDVLSLPPWAACLYYLIRPAHVLQRHGRRLVKNG